VRLDGQLGRDERAARDLELRRHAGGDVPYRAPPARRDTRRRERIAKPGVAWDIALVICPPIMTAEQLLAWVDRQLGDHAPLDADAGEIRNRFSQVVRARGEFDGTCVFGFTIPAELRDAESQITAKLDAALQTWRAYVDGIEGGPGCYQRTLQVAGITAPPARALANDPEIERALAGLRARLADSDSATALWRKHGWLEDGEYLAFAIAAPPEEIATRLAAMAAREIEMPPSLEALYRAIGDLWVGPAKQRGERAFDSDEESFVFAPLDTILERLGETETIILDQDPDYFRWVTLDPATDEIACANKLDRTPVTMARSLREYVEQLSAGYGRVLAR
jgi:hypothetical protein